MASIKETVKEFQRLRDQLIPNETFDEYKFEHEWTQNELRARQVLLGESVRLLQNMMNHDATEEEMTRLTRYFWILMESEKEGLDFNKARWDLDIPRLKNKYVQVEVVKA